MHSIVSWFEFSLSRRWWTGLAAMFSIVAVGLALWTVLESRLALMDAREQTAKVALQNEQLQRALVRPAIRVSRSRRAWEEMQSKQPFRFSARPDQEPNFTIALTI